MKVRLLTTMAHPEVGCRLPGIHDLPAELCKQLIAGKCAVPEGTPENKIPPPPSAMPDHPDIAAQEKEAAKTAKDDKGYAS